MKALLTRYGGIGDVAPVMVAARELKKRGYEITLALRDDEQGNKQTDLVRESDCYDMLWDYRQIGPWATRCVPYKHGWINIETTYEQFDEVIDFMFVVEGNSTCKTNFIKKADQEWKKSRGSNWLNWYDLHLMWANINPNGVQNDDKRPRFKLTAEEEKEAQRIRTGWDKMIAINPVASSLARTWYQAKDLIPMILKDIPSCLVAAWIPQKNEWEYHSAKGTHNIEIKGTSQMRKSMILLKAVDLYISVDTGFSHVAEGLNKKHLTIYSTVPWWTRSQYYKYEYFIDNGVEHPEYYTFALTAGDPLRVVDGEETLTNREKTLWHMHTSQMPLELACKELNTDAHGVNIEFEALLKKKESFSRIQSKSISTITPEMVLKKVKELI